MDASHRAALLTASCLRTPVNPRTKAPAARYEREPGRASFGDGAGQESLSPGREYNSIMYADCEDWLDVSDMYLSNQEYYLKLEELKNAHLETMAKLENMYQNKLFLKDVQPLTNSDVTHNKTYRSRWETSSFQLQNMHRSFSESDLKSSFHSNFSDETDEELELEASDSDVGSLALGKTENAWDGCSLKDYSLCAKRILPKLNVLKISKKKKKWFPKITVPEPFQMTIREAKRKQQNIKSKSLMQLENNILKKQLEEEAECQKKFRANPVPAYVLVPLYNEIMQENEERRKSLRERRREFLLATQKPFQFIEREAQKKELRKMQFSSPERTKIFKAKPVPKFVYSSEMREKLKEEELYRDIRIQVRSEELLRNSSLPNSRLGNRAAIRFRQQDCFEQSEKSECKPKTKVKVPDFETLHKKFQKQLQRHKNVKSVTISEPFNLHTPNIPSNKEKILDDIEMDEATLKETRWPYVSTRCHPRLKTLNASSYPSGCEQSPSPRITESTRRRLEAVRKSAEEKKKVEEEHKRRQAKQRERARKLQRLIANRAEANDPHQSLAKMHNSKLKLFRKHEKQRKKEYLQELEEIEERVEKRPLLLEQATQKNARLAAGKHYSDLLRELGLCEDFISKKGQTATEEFLQDCSNNSSESLAANVESDNGRIEKRESEGEDDPQLQSAQHSGEEEEEEEEGENAVAESDHVVQEATEHESENDDKDSIEKSSDYEG